MLLRRARLLDLQLRRREEQVTLLDAWVCLPFEQAPSTPEPAIGSARFAAEQEPQPQPKGRARGRQSRPSASVRLIRPFQKRQVVIVSPDQVRGGRQTLEVLARQGSGSISARQLLESGCPGTAPVTVTTALDLARGLRRSPVRRRSLDGLHAWAPKRSVAEPGVWRRSPRQASKAPAKLVNARCGQSIRHPRTPARLRTRGSVCSLGGQRERAHVERDFVIAVLIPDERRRIALGERAAVDGDPQVLVGGKWSGSVHCQVVVPFAVLGTTLVKVFWARQ